MGGEERKTTGVRLGIVGVTGLVGREMARLVEERDWPIEELRAFAGPTSLGQRVRIGASEAEVRALDEGAFEGLDLVLSSAGRSISEQWSPRAAAAGAWVVDNTSAFRHAPDCPLVVPEVNGDLLGSCPPGTIIANPNCSTIQLVLLLAPLAEAFGLERVIVSTYQSVSGAGGRALGEFLEGTRAALDAPGSQVPGTVLDTSPLIGAVQPGGGTEEELKMVREVPRILGRQVPLDVTCVRVPVERGHAESVWFQLAHDVPLERVVEVLQAAPGLVLATEGAPTPRQSAGELLAHVGRLRAANSQDRAFQAWVVADNILKGAAWNAVQIAEALLERPRAVPGA